MAQSSNNAPVIVTSVVVALISFGGGYFVGSHNVSTAKGDAASAAPGAGQSPTFGGAEGAEYEDEEEQRKAELLGRLAAMQGGGSGARGGGKGGGKGGSKGAKGGF